MSILNDMINEIKKANLQIKPFGIYDMNGSNINNKRVTKKQVEQAYKLPENNLIQMTDEEVDEMMSGKTSNKIQKKQPAKQLPPIASISIGESIPANYDINSLPPSLQNFNAIEKRVRTNQSPVDINMLYNYTGGVNYNPNIDNLLSEYSKQISAKNTPYIDAMQEYLNNYDRYLNELRNAQRYFTGLAGWTGNNRWADVANQYNRLSNEANKIALLKQLQEAKYSNIDEINKLRGNAEIAKSLGLPGYAALANKDLLNAYTAQQKNIMNYNARMYDTYLDNATRQAIEQGRLDLAIKLQNLKGTYGMNTAFINASPFYQDQAQMQQIMNMFGIKPQGQVNNVTNTQTLDDLLNSVYNK